MLLRWPPKRTVTRHRAPDRATIWRRIAAFDDWRQLLVLRIVVPTILMAVSAYYLTRWGLDNQMPWWLAWTLPAALDVSAYAALKVVRHPRNRWALVRAYTLVAVCLAFSVAGNIGSHAVDFGVLTPSFLTVAVTGSVYSLVFVALELVSSGMAPRPLTTEQEAAEATRKIAADEEVRAARAAARRRQQREDEVTRPAPAPAPAPAPTPAPTPAPAPVAVAPEADAKAVLARAVAYMRENPEAGRRKLADHLGITDHAAKQVHPAAKEAAMAA